MRPPIRPAALLLLLGAALPAPGAAQWEGWLPRRGMIEFSAGGAYTHYDRWTGGEGLGDALVPAFRDLVERLLLVPVAEARTGVEHILGTLPGDDPSDLAAGVGLGAVAFGLAADVRVVPFTLSYSISDRLALSATLPLERRGTAVTGLFLAGANLGINPDPQGNLAAMERVHPDFGAFGRGLLLPVAGSPAALELQLRLRAASPDDTLRLPAAPVRIEQLAALQGAGAPLSEEEAGALAATSGRRPYAVGDLLLGARFLLVRGPAGWPYPEAGARGIRAALGVRARLPTGRGGSTFLLEIPGEGGHAGWGVDLAGDAFVARRWSLHGGVALDHRLPADVATLAFGPERPFPADSAVRTVRRAPGARLEAALLPRWWLTDEIAFQGAYHLVTRRETRIEGGDGIGPAPLEWGAPGTSHGVGAGVRYSTLAAFGRGAAEWPYEVALELTTTVRGSARAPAATTIRFTARIFSDVRRLGAILPGRDAPPPAAPAPPIGTPPAPVPADTLPPGAPADSLPSPR
jgi:hypothetical protein